MARWTRSRGSAWSGSLARILAVGLALLPLLLAVFAVRADVAHKAFPSLPAVVELAAANQAAHCPLDGGHHGSGAAGPYCGVAHAGFCWLPLVAASDRPLPTVTRLCPETDPAFASLRYAPPLPPPIATSAS